MVERVDHENAGEKLSMLLELFPGGDFDYLLRKSVELGDDEEAFNLFVDDAIADSVVPTHITALPPNDLPSSSRAITVQPNLPTVFNMEKWLNKWPDPFAFFDNLQRTEHHKSQMVEVLKDRFRNIDDHIIINAVNSHGFNFIRSADILASLPPFVSSPIPRSDAQVRIPNPMDANLQNEILLFDHREEIAAHLAQQKIIKELAVSEGEIFECECCYADDVLPSETIMCSEAHIFCTHCVRRHVEVRIGDGHVTFPCLQNCLPSGHIPLKTVQTLVDSKTFEKLQARIQEREVHQADIPGLVFCQRCEYGAVLDESIVIFKCLKCNFELCRRCNKEAHIPLKCNETPQEDEAKQIRKTLEEKQTARLVRRCQNCKKPYVKSSGCDLIKCVCGTSSCYKCCAANVSYDHINRCQHVWTGTPVNPAEPEVLPRLTELLPQGNHIPRAALALLRRGADRHRVQYHF